MLMSEDSLMDRLLSQGVQDDGDEDGDGVDLLADLIGSGSDHDESDGGLYTGDEEDDEY